MSIRMVRSIAIATAVLGLSVLGPGAASAHEARSQGNLEMTVGFGTEPAYVGQPNSVQLILAHGGDPVVDLGDTLEVEVSFGEEDPLALAFEPFFAVGEFGTPGDYRAWFIPTSAGQYTFHLTGSIDGEDVDETFTSGPQTFDDVLSGSDIEYPVQDPTSTELADRIDREIPRLNDAIDEAGASAARTAEEASSDAATARTIGFVGVALGLLGVACGGAAVMAARRRS